LHRYEQDLLRTLENSVQEGLIEAIESKDKNTSEPAAATPKPKKNPVFKLSDDTYAMAFKAMTNGVCNDLHLTQRDWNDAFHSACMVFSIQLLLITCVFSVVFGNDFTVVFPRNIYTLGARFVVTILMHLIVEFDVRQGISMMKYTCNHWGQFRNPKVAFVIGFMQMFGGIATEICSMIYLSSITDTINTVIKFIALANISKVDDFYASALAGDYKLKSKVLMEIKNHRSDFSNPDNEECVRTNTQWVFRFIYKFFRMIYACVIYYFLPFFTLFIPYLI